MTTNPQLNSTSIAAGSGNRLTLRHSAAGREGTLFSAQSGPLDIENMLPIRNLATIWPSLPAAE